MLRVCGIFLLISQAALAQLSVEVKYATVEVATTPLIVTQVTLEDGTPLGAPVESRGETKTTKGAPVGLVFVQHDRPLSELLIKLRCTTADIEQVDVGVYSVSKPGKHRVEVNAIGQNPLIWDDETVEVVVGDSPAPEPGPDNPVGPDEFDNLGQRVARWSAGLPKRAEVGAVYLKHAKELVESPSSSVESVSKKLVAAVESTLAGDTAWVEVRKNINADLRARWLSSNDKRWLSRYYVAIAAGLGVAQ